MNQVDWKRKLTSRKFWVAVAAFVSGLMIALGNTQESATQVTALIMSGASVVAYIFGEGLADAEGAAARFEELGADGEPPDAARNA